MSTVFSRRILGWILQLGMIFLSLLLIAVGEWLPFMPAVQRFQEANPSANQILIGGSLVMTMLGFLLLVFTQLFVRVPDAHQRAESQADQIESRVTGRRRSFSGSVISAGFSDEARLWQMREAFRNGDWWRVARWRRMSLMLLGAILLFFGLFGLLFLLSPPGSKFLLFLVVSYATARSIYAFAVDTPNPQDDTAR